MANKLDTIQAFIAANPGSEWWVEEALFRGGRGTGAGTGGIVAGAHVTVGVRYTDAIDGDVKVRIFGPFPVNSLPNGATMAQTLGAIRISQQATIDQQTADLVARDVTINQQTGAIATRDATINQQKADLATRDTMIATLQAQVANLQQQLAAANAPKAPAT